MGCCASAEDYTPPGTAPAAHLVLTTKGDRRHLLRECARAPPARRRASDAARRHGHRSAVRPSARGAELHRARPRPRDMAMQVRQDGEFLGAFMTSACSTSRGGNEVGNHLSILRSTHVIPPYRHGTAAAFVVNSDGTISLPCAAPVLGRHSNLLFVPAESPLVCHFQHAKRWPPPQVPLTLASHPARRRPGPTTARGVPRMALQGARHWSGQ